MTHAPDQTEMINRLCDAIEGECDGLAIDDDQAKAILDHLDIPALGTQHVPVTVTDAMVDAAAKAMHDGPLGGDDEAEYTSDDWNRPAEWCRDMARAALTAALTPQVGRRE